MLRSPVPDVVPMTPLLAVRRHDHAKLQTLRSTWIPVV